MVRFTVKSSAAPDLSSRAASVRTLARAWGSIHPSIHPRSPPLPPFTCGLSAIGLVFLLGHLWFCDRVSVLFVALPGPLSRFGSFLLLGCLLLGQVRGHGDEPQGGYETVLREPAGRQTPPKVSTCDGMPGPCPIPLGNFPIEPPSASSAHASPLPILPGSPKPILVPGRSSNLNISSLGLRPPIPTGCLTLETLLLSRPPVKDQVLPPRQRSPSPVSPQLGAPRSSRPPRFAGLPPPVRLRPPLRRSPLHTT